MLVDKPVKIEELAKIATEGQLEKMIHLSPLRDYYTFRGKYYTVRFECIGSWEEVKAAVRQILEIHGKKGYALLNVRGFSKAHLKFIAAKASEIYGERIWPSKLIAKDLA